MRLIEVDRRSRRDVLDFLKLPFRLYRDVPQWVPPIMQGERARFKPDFAFNKHSKAAFYLVRNDAGQAVGRIAVQNNRPFNEYRKSNAALLYLYEAIEDDGVARCLFDAASEWARAQGLDRLVGPKGFMQSDGLGLLVQGFEHRPAIGIPYNHPYYVCHFEQIAGMTKEIDYISAKISRHGYEYPQKMRDLAIKVQQRRGFSVPEFKSVSEVRPYFPMLRKAYNEAFANLWAYTPIPEGDMDAMFEQLFVVAHPKLIKLIFKGDDVIGFLVALPDISAAIKRQNGEIWPFGWIDLLLEKRRTKWLNFLINAVLPQYQGLGANMILYDEMAKTLLDDRYEYGDLVQVQESNIKMLGDIEHLIEQDRYKRHRIYQKVL